MDGVPSSPATRRALCALACLALLLQLLVVPLHLSLHGHFAAGGRVVHVHDHAAHDHGHAHGDARSFAAHVVEHHGDEVQERHPDDEHLDALTADGARPVLAGVALVRPAVSVPAPPPDRRGRVAPVRSDGPRRPAPLARRAPPRAPPTFV